MIWASFWCSDCIQIYRFNSCPIIPAAGISAKGVGSKILTTDPQYNLKLNNEGPEGFAIFDTAAMGPISLM